MDRDVALQLAREAGWNTEHQATNDHIVKLVMIAAEHEREACAKLAEEEIKRVKPIYSVTAENVLKAIRGRNGLS